MIPAKSLLAAAALLLTGACGGDETMPAIEIAEAETFIETRLPPGARAIRSAGEQGIDTLVLMRFDAPENEALVFAERLLGAPPRTGVDPQIGSMGSGVDWWIETPPAGALGGSATQNATNRTFRILIAPGAGDDDTARVWLVAFSS